MGEMRMSTYVDASMIPRRYAVDQSVSHQRRATIPHCSFDRTLALQVLLEALEANISRCGEQQEPQVLLRVSTELLFLAEGHQDRRHVRPYDADGDKEEPQDGHASLEMDRQIGGLLPARECLGT